MTKFYRLPVRSHSIALRSSRSGWCYIPTAATGSISAGMLLTATSRNGCSVCLDRFGSASGGSETQAQRDLHRSGAARLEHRRQSAARAAGAQHQVQHRVGLPEQRIHEEAEWIGEVRLVHGIERLYAQLQRTMLAQRK